MNLTVGDYRELIRTEGDALLAQLERLGPEVWNRPSPCAGWDVLDVLVHMQLGAMIHVQMVKNAVAGRMAPPWTVPEGADPGAHFRQVHRDAYTDGPATNLARLRERLQQYDAALAAASDADLEKPAWFYGLPATLRTVVSVYTFEIIVHSTDIRRPAGLEPWFSPDGSRFAGPASMRLLPMFVTAERLDGAAGVIHQRVDDITTIATLGPNGLQVSPAADADADADAEGLADTPSAAIVTDGGTWTLLTWRSLPPAEAERLGRLQITGDRSLVERYLAAIKTP